MKLTDTQLVVLSTASRREDRAIEVPPNLKGGAARKLIGKLLSGGLVEEVSARGTLPVWRKDGKEGALSLLVTERGLDAIGLTETRPTESEAKPEAAQPSFPASNVPQPQAARRKQMANRKSPNSGGSGPSKQDHVLAMLRRPAGTTIPAIMKATGWQQHSVRGFFAGVVRKKLQFTLVSDKTPHGRIYRIPPDKGVKRTRKARGQA